MKIEEYHLESGDEHTVLSAVIAGHELWYRFPSFYGVPRAGDVFLAAALLPAMLQGEPILVDPALPISPKLLEGLGTIQNAFSSWYPMLRKIDIHARAEGGSQTETVGSFFSGGVDGAYTLLKHAEEITHLVFVKGIDMQVNNDLLFLEALACNRDMAKEFGKHLVPVETNVRFFGSAFKLNWTIYQGSGLASIALALGFGRVFIAATHTYSELFPWGSHPLTDPMWSTESTEIVHDGAEASRCQKLRKVAESPSLFKNLRVCWQDSGYNCGRCEKCLRTMAALRALGVSTPSLPRLESTTPIRRLRIEDISQLTYCEDTLREALSVGDRALARALSNGILRYHVRRYLVASDQLLFSSRLRRLWGHSS